MGFFGELKQDLSQAVEELMPENEENAATADTEDISDSATVASEDPAALMEELFPDFKTDEEKTDLTDSILEDLAKADETAEDEGISPDVLEVIPDISTEELSKAADIEEEASITADAAEEAETAEEKENASKSENKGEKIKMDTLAGKTPSDESSIVTAGMTITGDIQSDGAVDIVGVLNGNIEILGKLNVTGHINGDSKAAEIYAEGAKITGNVNSGGAVKIGASTVVIGNIVASSAAIAGAVKGDIDVNGPVILDTSAIVMGNIKSKSVQINNGAVIEGMCSQTYADVSPTSFFDDYKA
ncbi:MAG: polymer-forming cytoskeletal protein [Lachnospiraceae bacterium]|nr:polymer-forming cytoskeletal protein [Lachnospiraceae bacterium]